MDGYGSAPKRQLLMPRFGCFGTIFSDKSHMKDSLGWFKGKSTGNPWVFTIKLMGFSG